MNSATQIVPVSFLVLVYNQREWVADCIESVFRQDYPVDQLIVADDCSTDDTAEVVRQVMRDCANSTPNPPACELIVNRTNLGIIRNFNQGVARSRNELIIGHGGDDISQPHRVRRIVQNYLGLGSPKYYLSHSSVDVIGSPQPWLWRPPAADYSGDVLGIAASLALHIGASQAYTRALFEDFGPILDGTYEDLILGFRAALMESYHYLDEPMLKYRWGGVSLPGRNTDVEVLERLRITLQQRAMDAMRVGRLDVLDRLFDIYESAGFVLGKESRVADAELAPSVPTPSGKSSSWISRLLSGTR